MNLGRRDRTAPSRDTLVEIRDVVARETSGYRSGGLRIDWDQLDEDARRRVVELVKEAGAGGGWTWNRLSDRKRKELEGLIERGSDARGIFKDTRALEEIKALTEQAHTAAVRRPPSRKQESGIFAELGRCVAEGWLDASHVSVLVLIQIVLSTGRTLGPRSRIETLDDGGTALVVDRQFGLFAESFDPYGELGPRWMQTVDHLAANEWLIVEKNGTEWWIWPGQRMRAAMEGRAVKDVVAA
jgi:hypothetical protein